MAYRYVFTAAATRDVQDLARERQYARIVQLLVSHLPAILADPRGKGEPKSGPLRGCYGYTLSRGAGAAYRLVYEIYEDVVVILAIGAHDAAYRDATRRRQ